MSKQPQDYKDFFISTFFLISITACVGISRTTYTDNPKLFCLLAIGLWVVWDVLILLKFLSVTSIAPLMTMLMLVVSAMLPFLPKLGDIGLLVLYGSLAMISLALVFKVTFPAKPAKKL